ncbi:MAG: hypothetical protein R2771_03325 [Saprospiraceae bacterium]
MKNAGLPVEMDIDKSKILKLISGDKKKVGQSINFIALEEIGEAKIMKLKLADLQDIFLSVD